MKEIIKRVMNKITSDEEKLAYFIGLKDSGEIYRYCLSIEGGYSKEEFDDCMEKILNKAEKIENSKFGSKKSKVFSKILAAGLAALSIAPIVDNNLNVFAEGEITSDQRSDQESETEYEATSEQKQELKADDESVAGKQEQESKAEDSLEVSSFSNGALPKHSRRRSKFFLNFGLGIFTGVGLLKLFQFFGGKSTPDPTPKRTPEPAPTPSRQTPDDVSGNFRPPADYDSDTFVLPFGPNLLSLFTIMKTIGDIANSAGEEGVIFTEGNVGHFSSVAEKAYGLRFVLILLKSDEIWRNSFFRFLRDKFQIARSMVNQIRDLSDSASERSVRYATNYNDFLAGIGTLLDSNRTSEDAINEFLELVDKFYGSSLAFAGGGASKPDQPDFQPMTVRAPAPDAPDAPAEDAPAPDAPDAPAEDAPAPDAPDAPAPDAPDAPAPDAPAEDAPAPDAPAPDAPDAPAPDAPAEDAPAPDAPDAPAPDAPAEDAPAPDAPAEDAPAPDAPEAGS
ncbi:MAG: hypothetical protein LBK29_00740 [Oscillospiraceae bacterium]|jgi:hypothetical protein|nr:hypothetical protein [Oscillospiraceae bacterium]